MEEQEARLALDEIESQLDRDVYRPGPWASLIEEVRRRPRRERDALSDRISCVSDKLHRRGHARTLPAAVGLGLEAVLGLGGVALLEYGLRNQAAGALTLAAIALTLALQPLIKVSVGLLLGIRYSYFYVFGAEPRFKMRYGTYLAAPRWRRVAVHGAGTLGSVLALLWVSVAAFPVVPSVASVCAVLLALLVLFQLGLFILVAAGVQRVGRYRPARISSAGAAAYELFTSPGRAAAGGGPEAGGKAVRGDP